MAMSILFRHHCIALHSRLQRLADALEPSNPTLGLEVSSILSDVQASLNVVEGYGSNLSRFGSDRELNRAVTIAYFRHQVPHDGEAHDGVEIERTQFSWSYVLSHRTLKALGDHIANGGPPADFALVVSGLVPLWNIREFSFGQITGLYRNPQLVPRYGVDGVL